MQDGCWIWIIRESSLDGIKWFKGVCVFMEK